MFTVIDTLFNAGIVTETDSDEAIFSFKNTDKSLFTACSILRKFPVVAVKDCNKWLVCLRYCLGGAF